MIYGYKRSRTAVSKIFQHSLPNLFSAYETGSRCLRFGSGNLLTAIRSQPFFENDEKAKAWLIVTASNCCKTQLGKWWRKKRGEYDEELVKNRKDNKSSEILQLVLSLEPKYSIPAYLYYFEGYRTGEIADMLKTKASTIQTRLAKARKLLKMELETDRFVSEGGQYACRRI